MALGQLRVVKTVAVFETDSRENDDEKKQHVDLARRARRLRVLQDNLQDDIAGVAATVDHLFEQFVERSRRDRCVWDRNCPGKRSLQKFEFGARQPRLRWFAILRSSRARSERSFLCATALPSRAPPRPLDRGDGPASRNSVSAGLAVKSPSVRRFSRPSSVFCRARGRQRLNVFALERGDGNVLVSSSVSSLSDAFIFAPALGKCLQIAERIPCCRSWPEDRPNDARCCRLVARSPRANRRIFRRAREICRSKT